MKRWQKGLDTLLKRLKSGEKLSNEEIKESIAYYEGRFLFDEEEMTIGQAIFWDRKIDKLKSYLD